MFDVSAIPFWKNQWYMWCTNSRYNSLIRRVFVFWWIIIFFVSFLPFILIHFLFHITQRLFFVKRSTPQQRACLQRKRERFTLLVRSSSPHSCFPRAPGFFLSFFLLCLSSSLLFWWIYEILDEPFCHSTHQVKKMMHNIRNYQVPLQRYMAMMDLQVSFQ